MGLIPSTDDCFFEIDNLRGVFEGVAAASLVILFLLVALGVLTASLSKDVTLLRLLIFGVCT